jgi:hypothetical protein
MPRVLFTRESAREMARRSNEVQAAKRRERASIASPAAYAITTATPEPQYAAIRLIRVRGLLDRIDRMMAIEADPQKLDRLAAAADKLSQQECWLSGRPRPGVRKPTRGRAYSMDNLPPLTAPDPEPVPLAWLAPAPERPHDSSVPEAVREEAQGGRLAADVSSPAQELASPGPITPASPLATSIGGHRVAWTTGQRLPPSPAAAPAQPAKPAPNAPQSTASPAIAGQPPVSSPLSPLIQRTGTPARLVRLPDGKLGYAPVVPTPAKRP